MSFYKTQDFPNRKDNRKPAKSDPGCNPHGGCSYCLDNRMHATRQREEAAEDTREEDDRET